MANNLLEHTGLKCGQTFYSDISAVIWSKLKNNVQLTKHFEPFIQSCIQSQPKFKDNFILNHLCQSFFDGITDTVSIHAILISRYSVKEKFSILKQKSNLNCQIERFFQDTSLNRMTSAVALSSATRTENKNPCLVLDETTGEGSLTTNLS